ncbi:uncharacterized protein LOC129768709 [Toxorhynchites rutilus septentrionalis]|uniref:uncharacterized protein LOC129768709 n=1 Tax=Toxorhynchites rutilus septentrionalis TaxID=329112 RepID=UPI00247A5A50|nr:uncharacterized protein LOC129768709 [Toxorhynchites rutilus septentrionalis]
MNRLCLTVFAILLSLAYCQAYVAFFPNAVNKDFPGECYDPQTKIHFKPGQKHQRKTLCEEMICNDDLSLSYYGCGVVVMDDPRCVKVEKDLTKDYPACCRTYKCEIDGNVSYH